MKYIDATIARRSYLNLIGTRDENRLVIDDIVIAPADVNEQLHFIKKLLCGYNNEAAIRPYLNEDVQLWAIDKYHLKKDGIFAYKILD